MSDDSSRIQQDAVDPVIDFKRLSQRDKRALVFHVLYAAEMYEYQLMMPELIDMLNEGFSLSLHTDYPEVLMAEYIIQEREKLDEVYKPLLANWRFERLGVCTRLILRYAIWELKHTTTDTSVIINEAVELAKCFAERDAHKFINGVLDELVKQKIIERRSFQAVS